MKAWVLRNSASVSQDPLRLEEVTDPSPNEGELLIKVSACGVCHTDLHTVEGEIVPPHLPIIPGHQAVGRVVRVGPGVLGFKAGDRVGVPWLFSTCGACVFCRSNRENLCPEGRFTGFHENGGYAEFLVARGTFTFHLPDAIDDIHSAPLLCAGIIGYRALKVCGIERGETLGLFGFGASAHIAIQIAVWMGVRVFAFSRSEEHRRHALDLGASWAGMPGDDSPSPLDAAISFAPSGTIIPFAMEKLQKGGTLALAGIYVDALPAMDYEKHLFYEKSLRSVTAFTREDAARFFGAAAEARVATEVEVYPFRMANEVLQRLKAGKIKGAAVLRIEE